MSRVFMLKPADGIEGVKNAILTAVRDAGPNACPPMVVGVGIGGTFEKCAIMAKHALIRNLNEHSEIPYVADLEEDKWPWNRSRWPGRYSNSTVGQCGDVSDSYCRITGSH